MNNRKVLKEALIGISLIVIFATMPCSGMDAAFASRFMVAAHTGIADPKTDTGFKQLMSTTVDGSGSLVAISVLNSFIPDFQKDPVTFVQEMPLAIPPLKETRERQVLMDFHVKTRGGEHVIVEMQVKRHIFFDERALFYTAYTYSHQLEAEKLKGTDWYKQIKKTYSLQFLNYDSNRAGALEDKVPDTLPARVAGHPMTRDSFVKHYMMTDQHSKQTIDAMQMIQIELARITGTSFQFPPTPTRQIHTMHWWLGLLKTPERFTPEFIETMEKQGTPVPQEIIAGLGRLDFAKWRPELVKMYDEEEIDKVKYATEFASERFEGIKQGTYDTALQSWIDVFIGSKGQTDPSTILSVAFPPTTQEYVAQAWGQKPLDGLKQFLTLLQNKGLLPSAQFSATTSCSSSSSSSSFPTHPFGGFGGSQ